MNNRLKGKKILMTGGAGSVGFALTRYLLKYDIEAMRIFDISENEMFKIKNAFRKDDRIRFLIGDIRDLNRLKLAMENIDIVLHLAAMKHVYACEYNPFEAIKTNVDGLQNVIDAARNMNVEKVIFTSTDKAASPSNVMGMTKLLAEKLISLANYYKGDKRTVFSSVRFGNVIGSNGSVVPLFKQQISSGGPLTITDMKMTRFVITMQEAIDLIFNAVSLAKGGETFIWKMRTMNVMDLAKAMIRKYGPNSKIDIKIIGKGEGEKIHEEIMSSEEATRTVELGDLYILFPEIDHEHVDRKYTKAKRIKNPVIASNQGLPMSQNDLGDLLIGLKD